MVARRSTAWRVSYQPTPREKARALRLPSAEWRRYLGDPRMQASYHARVCRAAGCWFWVGALSESGHGRLRRPAPSHWVAGDAAANAADYAERREDPPSPLSDKRGAGGRARAIRAAILRAQAEGRDVDRAVRSAIEAGMPGVQDTLAFGS